MPPRIREAIRLALQWEAGHLPDPGGVLDQSAWMLEAFGVVMTEINEYRDREMERARGR